MSSECLREIFGELDGSSDTVQFSLSPDSQFFRITTFGTSGTYHVCIEVSIETINVFIL